MESPEQSVRRDHVVMPVVMVPQVRRVRRAHREQTVNVDRPVRLVRAASRDSPERQAVRVLRAKTDRTDSQELLVQLDRAVMLANVDHRANVDRRDCRDRVVQKESWAFRVSTEQR